MHECMQGASSGVVRYTAPGIVEKALKLANGDGKLEIAGITAILRKIEGERPCGSCVYALIFHTLSQISEVSCGLPQVSSHVRP